VRGPAPVQQADGKDIIDEAINFFRANVMFKNFEMKGPADRTLCYLTLFIHQVGVPSQLDTLEFEHSYYGFVNQMFIYPVGKPLVVSKCLYSA
jgi:hypothetical protein